MFEFSILIKERVWTFFTETLQKHFAETELKLDFEETVNLTKQVDLMERPNTIVDTVNGEKLGYIFGAKNVSGYDLEEINIQTDNADVEVLLPKHWCEAGEFFKFYVVFKENAKSSKFKLFSEAKIVPSKPKPEPQPQEKDLDVLFEEDEEDDEEW